MTKDEKGHPIEDEQLVKKNRVEFLVEEGYQTDNTNVQSYKIRNQVVSVTETMIINVHDIDNFMKTIRRIDLRLIGST